MLDRAVLQDLSPQVLSAGSLELMLSTEKCYATVEMQQQYLVDNAAVDVSMVMVVLPTIYPSQIP